MDIDKLLGSAKFKVGSDLNMLDEAARQILANPIDPATFDQKSFLKKATDIIAVDRTLSQKMKSKWLTNNS